jgi:hypothetical protein
MENFNELVKMVNDIKEDVEKFFTKQNSSAGTRVRLKMQEIKKVAQLIRDEISEQKKQ